MKTASEALDSQEALRDRMESLVRAMSGNSSVGLPFGNTALPVFWSSEHYAEARAIVAELPPPVDPDLIEAREIVASVCNDGDWNQNYVNSVRDGRQDNTNRVKGALAAIRRGRELQRGEAQ